MSQGIEIADLVAHLLQILPPAAVDAECGRVGPAKTGYEVVLAGLSAIVGDTKPQRCKVWVEIARVHSSLGELLFADERPELALPHLLRSREIREAAFGTHSAAHAATCLEASRCLAALGRYDEAAAMVRKAHHALLDLDDGVDELRLKAHALHHAIELKLGHATSSAMARSRAVALSRQMIERGQSPFAVFGLPTPEVALAAA